jgi:HD superfamily phosphohydrolase YqeK
VEPDRPHDDPARLDRAAVRAPGRGLTPEEVRARVVPRLSAARLVHVESVAKTIGILSRRWDGGERAAALRAAWLHDSWRSTGLPETLAAIRAHGEEPDPWTLAHAPVLLHAQAAAVWARSETSESDPRVLLAVRHHPTGHPDWEDLGRALYVADFCEATRAHAASLGTGRLVARAAEGSASLAAVAREVMATRLGRSLRKGRAVHPDSWRTWNAWAGAAEMP